MLSVTDKPFMMSVIMLNVVKLSIVVPCHPWVLYTMRYFAEIPYTECHYAECHGTTKNNKIHMILLLKYILNYLQQKIVKTCALGVLRVSFKYT
jgi:hypothetical protein